jgi:hypothetical protein
MMLLRDHSSPHLSILKENQDYSIPKAFCMTFGRPNHRKTIPTIFVRILLSFLHFCLSHYPLLSMFSHCLVPTSLFPSPPLSLSRFPRSLSFLLHHIRFKSRQTTSILHMPLSIVLSSHISPLLSSLTTLQIFRILSSRSFRLWDLPLKLSFFKHNKHSTLLPLLFLLHLPIIYQPALHFFLLISPSPMRSTGKHS